MVSDSTSGATCKGNEGHEAALSGIVIVAGNGVYPTLLSSRYKSKEAFVGRRLYLCVWIKG